MKKLYGMRSAVVHGHAKIAEVNEYSPIAEQVLQDVIKWYLDKGISIGQPDTVAGKIDEDFVANVQL
ncbi:MAG: hypothetical protein H6908_05570 [Hyphomicrobiales bacterium]|nr:hypothetical protein [Hyphomicrobiales bacterium]